MLEKTIKHIILISLFAILCLPEWYLPKVLERFPGLQPEQLGGSFDRMGQPEFKTRTWLSRRFQRTYAEYLKTHSENAPFFIKARNQLNYKWFHNIAAEDILLGKEGNLHSIDYCKAYIGYKCCDEPLLGGIADTLQQINKWLEGKNKRLLILLPPGKARVMPENMPEFYQKNVSDLTNWHRMADHLSEMEVPYMDFQFLIDQYKGDTPEYPLFPQFGLHWSSYGVTVSADSLKDKIETMLQIEMPEMVYQDQIRLDTNLSLTDEELLFGSNLFYDLPKQAMPYPEIEYVESEQSTRPNVLIIGDSFYKVLFEEGIQEGLFDKASSFWYYYKTIRPQGGNAQMKSLKKEIASRDVIILQAGELNITSMGYGFLEKMMTLIESYK